MLIGIAQEKASVFRPCGRRQREKGKYSVTRASAFINHVYYCYYNGANRTCTDWLEEVVSQVHEAVGARTTESRSANSMAEDP